MNPVNKIDTIHPLIFSNDVLLYFTPKATIINAPLISHQYERNYQFHFQRNQLQGLK